ncbi:(Na+)-NQR maturation NqrM [Dichelobacter nodosus]|uniref:(Na+)-NQR maturation NqrM n=1 Tax=Dichelobacter nodosus (strain VCS1703A) TaxID=246195 RepID=A5EUU1_DICNV|nr:(Na+)-NQR maturation NqrM [Dichelobacter nodosus]ABQ13711.1 conserved hypothetical protein [Dichelobacter nodosus VCS1703A]KNZ38907.1 hypothetical protein AKG33_06725 [Dichelobacter nodosus]
MIKIFIIAFVMFTVVILAMAVGVLFGRKPISGSCGGLASVGVKRACGCTDVCRNEIKNEETPSSPPPVKIYRPH